MSDATPVLESWPPAEAFWIPADDDQQSDGSARCTGIAVCDEDGGPVRAVHQGQRVQFLFEFEVDGGSAGVAAGSIELRDGSGLLVHGKSSFQTGAVAQLPDGGCRLRYRHVVRLDLAPGEYFLTVGLSSTDEYSYLAYRHEQSSLDLWPEGVRAVPERSERYRPVRMPEEQFDAKVREHCRAAFADALAVGFDRTGRRTHAGVANLPGLDRLTIEAARPSVNGPASALPTVVHITHHKAGSQWIYEILRACVPDRIATPSASSGYFRYWPPEPGAVYPTVYLSKDEFDRVPLRGDCRTFVVVRDLRDTLVSAYFSIVGSHTLADRESMELRRGLASMPLDLGLVYLMDNWLAGRARIQLSWLEAGKRLIRYEDLLEHDVEILEEVLLDECELGVPLDRLRRVVESKRFEALSGGRRRGTEDRSAHFRKGVAGDWRNHFSDAVRDAFKARYGGLLVATGYERDLDW